MKDATLKRLDAASAALLLLWTGMALGFGALAAPLLFRMLPSRDFAGQVAGAVVVRLDWAAWVAFGGAFLMSFVPRWLEEVADHDVIGPLRLWTAGVLAALLLCLASSFIVTPRIQELRSDLKSPIESLPADSPLRSARQKAHRFSTQFFYLRVLLALGLAAGTAYLPGLASRRKEPEAGG